MKNLCNTEINNSQKGASLMAQWWRICPPMQETHVWSPGWEDALEEDIAIHSYISAWRTPRAEEPGRLQSTELNRIGHKWNSGAPRAVHRRFSKTADYRTLALVKTVSTSGMYIEMSSMVLRYTLALFLFKQTYCNLYAIKFTCFQVYRSMLFKIHLQNCAIITRRGEILNLLEIPVSIKDKNRNHKPV